MKVFFKRNALFTKLKVSSTISAWTQEYESMVDTGAFMTAIPRDEIIPPNNTGANLEYLGPHYTHGVGFKGYLDKFEATILVGEEDEYKEIPIIAVPNDSQYLLGRDIISKYKWEIDWKIQKVVAILNQ